MARTDDEVYGSRTIAGDGYIPSPNTSSGGKTKTVGGVTYYQDPMFPGVWVSPWGQRGYFEVKPGTFKDSPVTESFVSIADRYFDGSDGSGADMRPREFDDPRYWDLQYKQLEQDLLNSGLDAESARRQALASLITSRNSTAADLYSTDVNAAKIGAEFAGNPRDALSDIYYRNAVGGATPYGDMSGEAGGQLQQGLFNRFNEIFGGIAGSRAKAWDFASAIPPSEYLQPSSAGGDINRNTTLPGAAQGGVFNIDPGVPNEEKGYSPSSTEGGLNLNIFEPAVIMGVDSGRIYAKLAEPRPDGTRRGEQVVVKPLKSETEKDKMLQEMGKQPVSGNFPQIPGMATGGTAKVLPRPDEFINQVKINLSRLGGSGGGAGGATDPNTGVAPLRLYAGAPDAAMSPTQRAYLYAVQSQAGVSPEEVDWTLKQFSHTTPINNFPRVSF